MIAKDIKEKMSAGSSKMPKEVKELLEGELHRLHELIKTGQSGEWAMKQIETITKAIITYSHTTDE